MKRGQSTLEYIVLIGSVAAGIIAMLVYIGRGHQGNIRSQADQLGARQYEWGKTTINNTETKTLTSRSGAESTTTVTYGNMNEPDQKSIEARSAIKTQLETYIYPTRRMWESTAVSEAQTGASLVRAGKFWAPPATGLNMLDGQLNAFEAYLVTLRDNLKKAEDDWAKRIVTKDRVSTISTEIPEIGTTGTRKTTSETLGDL